MPKNNSSVGIANLVDTKDILKLVVGKLSSQILLYSISIIIFIIVSYSLWGKDGLIPTILILVVFIIGSVGYLFFEQKQKVERGEPQTINKIVENKMKNISNIQSNVVSNNTNLSIELWAEKSEKIIEGSRDINIVPTKSGGAFKVGDKINIKFKASKNCYLTLLNIGTSGKLTILFPNKVYSDNFIEANKLYEIPGKDYGFEYQLQGPIGTEKLKAIVTSEKITLIESQFSPDGSIFKTM
ncbi:MAG: DUF4384 domain-containing protein, partial [Ignavibacteriaceae bacterium]